MVPLNQEQHLGEKAYLLMVSRRTLPGLVLLLVSLVFLIASGFVGNFVASSLEASGATRVHAVAMASSYVSGTTIGLFAVSLLLFLIGLIIARLEYSNYSYMFEEFDLRMRRGILSRTETSLPYRQIQDVDIDRSIIYRMMGLSRLIILSAGHEESSEHDKAQVVLEPIAKEAAEEIRLTLERKIGVQITKSEAEADQAMNDEASAAAQKNI